MCILGDGTTNIGAFHESLNLAGIWNLPIVYVIVNNKLGMGTTVEAASAEPDLYKRGSAYRIPGERVDGDDPIAVRDGALRALEAREGGAPAHAARGDELPAARAFRRRPGPLPFEGGHGRGAGQRPGARRSAHEAHRRARCSTEAAAEEIHVAADKTVTDAVAFADASPDPTVDQLFDYVYATAGGKRPARTSRRTSDAVMSGEPAEQPARGSSPIARRSTRRCAPS